MPKLIIITLITFVSITSFAQKIASLKEMEASGTSQSVTFTENKGQVSDQYNNPRPDVLFSGSANGMVFHLRDKGISYELTRIDSWKEVSKLKDKRNVPDQITVGRIDIKWLNCNTNASVIKDKDLEGYANYFLSACPNGIYKVKSYAGVTYKNIYKNIDLHYYEKDKGLKYDYIVSPHADYRQINIELGGLDKAELQEDGSLIFKTPLGEIHEGAPIVFQNGNRLEAKWVIEGNVLSFDIKSYNPEFSLIIDPTVKLWGTYYGSNFYDAGFASCTDASGNVFLAGETMSNSGTFIATTGGHQNSFASGTVAFLAKFNSLGVRQWGTYYGVNNERAYSCAADVSGNIYMTGVPQATTTPSVIATLASHQGSLGGGGRDAFLVKFNSSGVRQWGTFYGGSGQDEGLSCTTDASSNVYLTGWTMSTGTAIATTTGFQSTAAGTTSWSEAFLVKFSSGGVRQWGTFYGSTGDDYACATHADASGNIYMCGYTNSSSSGTAIASTRSHQSTLAGNFDAFLVKFGSSGNRIWGTFYGGASGNDYAQAMCTDAMRHVYITGYTASGGTVMATQSGHQTSASFNNDAYLVQFDSTGTRQWATYYGDAGIDEAKGCSIDLSNGDVYICGVTTSTTSNAIGSTGSYQSSWGGSYDAFLAKFSVTGTRLWGSYFGGGGVDYGYSCSTDNVSGTIYLAGSTTTGISGSVVATPGAHQTGYGGSTDAFLVKLFDDCNYTLTAQASPSTAVCPVTPVTYTALGASTYTWLPQNIANAMASVIPSVPTVYTVQASLSGCSTVTSRSFTLQVHANPTISVSGGSVCLGSSFTLSPSGAQTYSYSSGSSVVTPVSNTSYTVTGTNNFGCISASPSIVTVTVNALPTFSLSGNNSVCKGSGVSQIASGTAVTYSWSNGLSGNLVTLNPIVSTTYTVTGTDYNGCSTNITTFITVNPLPTINVNSGTICVYTSFTFIPSGAISYTFPGGSALYTPQSNTFVTIYGADNNGCVGSATSSITTVDHPALGVTNYSPIFCAGETTTLVADGASTYTWNGVATGNPYTVAPAQTQTMTITGANAFGCTSTMIFQVDVQPCVSVAESKEDWSGLSVYPNPGAGIFIISSESLISVKISNAIGQMIGDEKMFQGKMEIDLTNYSDGVYFIHCQKNNSLKTFKLIKQN